MPDDTDNFQYAVPGPYTTQLSPAEEQSFQKWVKDNKIPWQDTPDADYDMRGFYKALISGDPRAKQQKSGFDQKMHFPDVWKTPFHKTFSNESQYAKPDAPHWDGDKLIDKSGKVLKDETPKPSSNTQDFWTQHLLKDQMPAARNEQEYQKEQDDWMNELEQEHGLDTHPDDWAVKGTKSGKLDKMQKDAPPYYPVPGDVLKDDQTKELKGRSWMKPAPSFDSVEADDLTWDHFPLA